MRSAILVAMLGCTACGGPAKSAEAPPESRTAATPQLPAASASWWCTFASDDQGDAEIGACTPDEASCIDSRKHLIDVVKIPADALAACVRTTTAACFHLQTADGIRDVCHPTMATCRSHLDWLAPDEQALSACQRRGAAIPQAEDEVHWWCLSLYDTGTGVCARSHEKCEAIQRDIKRDFPNDKLSGCEPRVRASCTDITIDGIHRRRCGVTESHCRSLVEATGKYEPGAQISACHLVE